MPRCFIGGDAALKAIALYHVFELRCCDRLIRNWVGFSPKRLARIMRFQALLQHMETSPSDCSTRVAAELGYFDQAHLANELRCSPARAQDESPRIVWPIFPRDVANELINSP
jgi:hypothetical protein